MATFHCAFCKKEVRDKPSHIKLRKYCSRKCRYTERKKLICPICKIEFEQYKNGHKNSIFCSNKCHAKDKSNLSLVKIICKGCNVEFTKRKCERKKFCSYKCASIFNRGDKNPRYIKYYPDKYCIQCHGKIPIKYKSYYLRKQKFCNIKCSTLYISNKRKGIPILSTRGKNHYNWKGDKYSQNYRERRKFRDELQKTIFERDNYTCQICGIRGTNLQVDHIQSWADYVELRFNINNCRTLCVDCHYQITFGKPMSKNTKGWGHNLIQRRELQ